MEPVVATILGTVIYHEMLSLYEVIGIVLVLGAIVISNGKSPAEETGRIRKTVKKTA